MQTGVERSENIGALVKALCAAKQEFGSVVKNKTGKVSGESKAGKFYEYDYKYADLAGVLAAIEEPLAKHGLSLLQFPCTVEGKQAIVSFLAHESGEWMSSTVTLPAMSEKATPQNYGALLTYVRRYSACGILQIPLEDDDANLPVRKQKLAPGQPEPITQAQQQAIFRAGKAKGIAPQELLKIVWDIAGVESSKEIPSDKFEPLLKAIEGASNGAA